jgi:hypothetical protein
MTRVDPCPGAGQGLRLPVFAPDPGPGLNLCVTAAPATSYRLAPALAAQIVGRGVVALAVLVAVATVVGLLLGVGWVLAGVVAAVGVVVVVAVAGWLFRGARALRLTDEGYAVRFLGGVGVTSARWDEVAEALASSAQGRPYLVVRLSDGRSTRLPMAALAADRDVVALDVRRRLRDAHTDPEGGPAGNATDDPADSAPGEQSL